MTSLFWKPLLIFHKLINLGFSASTGWSGTTSHLRYCFGTPHFHESSTHPSLNIRNCQAISDIQMIENIIMSSHAPQIDINGLTVVYRFLALLIKWWCSGTGNRTPTIQTTGRRLSTHGHPSGPRTFEYFPKYVVPTIFLPESQLF